MHTRLIKGNNLRNRNVNKSQVWSCGTMVYGPTLNKKGVDIQCDQVSRYDGEQLVNYVGNNISAKGEGRRVPFSCSLRQGGPIGKVLVHRWSPKVIKNCNRLYGQVVHRSVYISKELSLLR